MQISEESLTESTTNSGNFQALELKRQRSHILRILQDREALPKSLKAYTEAAWHLIEPGHGYIPGWHIDAIAEHLQACYTRQIRNLVITIPPRHTKSIEAAVMFPTWCWVRDPRLRFLYSSYASPLAIRDALKSRRLIQSTWYQERWGGLYQLTSDQNAKIRFENNKTGLRIATSVDGIGTGEGGDFVIVDDPHNVREAESEAIRESVIVWWDEAMSTRLNDPKTGVRIIIMQRTHHSDLAAHVLKQGGYEHLNLPAEFEGAKKKTIIGWQDPRTKRGELLCPDRFGAKEIAELKVRLGPYAASAQLQQRPTPREGGIYKRAWFRHWPANQKLPLFHFIIQSYDTAYTEKTSNDPSACSVWGLFKIRGVFNVMLLDAWKEHLEYPKLRRRVKADKGAEYGEADNVRRADLILIEQKGSGINLIQDLGSVGVQAWPYNPHKQDKTARLVMATPVGAAGLVWVLESDKRPGEPVGWSTEFISDVIQAGPASKEWDWADTFTQAMLYFSRNNMLEAKLNVGEEAAEPVGYESPKAHPYAA